MGNQVHHRPRTDPITPPDHLTGRADRRCRQRTPGADNPPTPRPPLQRGPTAQAVPESSARSSPRIRGDHPQPIGGSRLRAARSTLVRPPASHRSLVAPQGEPLTRVLVRPVLNDQPRAARAPKSGLIRPWSPEVGENVEETLVLKRLRSLTRSRRRSPTGRTHDRVSISAEPRKVFQPEGRPTTWITIDRWRPLAADESRGARVVVAHGVSSQVITGFPTARGLRWWCAPRQDIHSPQ